MEWLPSVIQAHKQASQGQKPWVTVSRPVGGILSTLLRGLGGHPSERSTWGRCSRRNTGRAAQSSCLTLLRVGFTEPSGSPRALVRSYRTVSPLPVRRPGAPPSAVCFLWHCPAGRPDWPLASTLPYGVPTFLDPTPVEGVTSFRNEPRPPGRLTVDLMFSQTGGSFPALSQPRSSLSPWHLLPQCPRPDLKDRSGQRYRSASSTVGSIVPFVRRSRASCGCRGRSGPSR